MYQVLDATGFIPVEIHLVDAEGRVNTTGMNPVASQTIVGVAVRRLVSTAGINPAASMWRCRTRLCLKRRRLVVFVAELAKSSGEFVICSEVLATSATFETKPKMLF